MDAKMPMDRDEILDAAAGEALSANSPETSEQYRQAMASGDAETVRADREMRETVARVALASPYMEPSAELRGKILQATAPQTFKMEDYRKASSDNRFFKWGFYAAAAFLIAAAYYNLSLQSGMKKMQMALENSQKQLLAAAQQADSRGNLLNQVLDPKSNQIAITKDGQIVAVAYVNEQTKTGVLIVPEGAIKPGQNTGTLSLARGQEKISYRVSLVGANGLKGVEDTVVARGMTGTSVKTESVKVETATMGGGN